MDLALLSEKNISQYLEPYLSDSSTFMEALAEFVEQNDIDPEMIAALIKNDDVLYNVMKSEARAFHLLKKEKETRNLLDF